MKNTPKNRPNTFVTSAGRLAAAAVVAAVFAAGAYSPAPNVEHVDLSGVAAWAEANGLRGLSPASVRAVDSSPAGLAEWAEENGLSGLSPASLSPVGE